MKKCQEKTGTLIIAGTHLGCPQDTPPRTLRALREADLLIFEEDRPARQLLKAAGVFREYLRHNEHHQHDGQDGLALTEARRTLEAGGSVCYTADQGMPGLADPGWHLVRMARDMGAKLQVIPGPSSITTAVAACPFSCANFYFAGFLPRRPEERRESLQELADRREAIVIMDTPYRLLPLLEDVGRCDKLGRREGVLALDISGPDEDFLMDSLEGLAAIVAKQAKSEGKNKRNFVLVIQGQ